MKELGQSTSFCIFQGPCKGPYKVFVRPIQVHPSRPSLEGGGQNTPPPRAPMPGQIISENPSLQKCALYFLIHKTLVKTLVKHLTQIWTKSSPKSSSKRKEQLHPLQGTLKGLTGILRDSFRILQQGTIFAKKTRSELHLYVLGTQNSDSSSKTQSILNF